MTEDAEGDEPDSQDRSESPVDPPGGDGDDPEERYRIADAERETDPPTGEMPGDEEGGGDDADREGPMAGVASEAEQTLGAREDAPGTDDGPRVERPSTGGGDREGPLSDVADDIDERTRVAGDNPEAELFDQEQVPEIDREELWRQVAGDGTEAESPAEERRRIHDRATEEDTERIIDKEKYCQGCEYFSPPPDVHCSHEGTRIAELVDMNHFRVFDCPVVAEDEELENY